MWIFIVWFMLSICVGAWASGKGRNGFGAFVLALLLSPLVGFIIVAILKDKTAEAAAAARDAKLIAAVQAKDEGDTRACPRCAETIKRLAVVCRFCNAELSPVFAPAPAAPAQVRPVAAPAPKEMSVGTAVATLVGLCVAMVLAFFVASAIGANSPRTASAAAPSQIDLFDGCYSARRDIIPAVNAEIGKRLVDSGSFEHVQTRAKATEDGSALEVLVSFTARNAAKLRQEGMAFATVKHPACGVVAFEWICLQPGFGPAAGQLHCNAKGEPEPA